MTEVTINAPTEPIVETPSVEAGAEAIAEAAVEVAEIEAKRDVKIAEIQAETQVAQSEAIAENNHAAELEQCQRSIETLNTQIAEMRETMQSILLKLTPAESPPPNQPAESESLEATPANPAENAETVAEEPKPALRKRNRWI